MSNWPSNPMLYTDRKFDTWARDRAFYHILHSDELPIPCPEEAGGYVSYWRDWAIYHWFMVYARFTFLSGNWTHYVLWRRML